MSDPLSAVIFELLREEGWAGQARRINSRAIALACERQDAFDRSRQLRFRYSETGLWPLVISALDVDPARTVAVESGASSEAVIADALLRDPWSVVPVNLEMPAPVEDYAADLTSLGIQASTVIARWGELVSPWQVERILYEEASKGSGSAPRPSLSPMPHPSLGVDNRYVILLARTADPPNSLAFVRYDRAPTWQRRANFVAAAREWFTRWGAVPVWTNAIDIEFVVDRPPTDPEDAWELAGQLFSFGSYAGLRRDEYAGELPHLNRWNLSSKP